MSTTEFPDPGQGTAASGITSQERARPIVLHNNRIVCWFTMIMGISSMFIGLCMILMVFSVLFPLKGIGFMRVLSAVQWGLGGVVMCLMCPWLWQWGARMIGYRIKLDERGLDFNLGTKKKPRELFIPWDQVTSIQQKNNGKSQAFTVLGASGNSATFTSNTFFRPGRIAKIIAERAGLTIHKV